MSTTASQLTIADAIAGAAARDEAIARAAQGAPDGWIGRALDVVRDVASKNETFTTDDVWLALGDERPAEPRALGAVMRAACDQRIAAPTNRVAPSSIRTCHRRPKRVWKSLAIRGAA